VPKKKSDTVRLSVFKGREAKLNRAIFQVLKEEAPQAMWDILRKIRKMRGLKHTKYAVINKRINALEAEGYLKKTGERETKHGGKTALYEISAKAKLAIKLCSQPLDDRIDKLDEDSALIILNAINSSK
jgi:DNA-binding PadR family transcriptional regulator